MVVREGGADSQSVSRRSFIHSTATDGGAVQRCSAAAASLYFDIESRCRCRLQKFLPFGVRRSSFVVRRSSFVALRSSFVVDD